MKTTANQETLNLEKIEKTTDQILKKLNRIRSNFFVQNLKFSKKAKEEKVFLCKSFISKKILLIEKSIVLFREILVNPKFPKLEKEDQDFILGLETAGFKDSQYAREINAYVTKETESEDIFMALIEENLYFSILYGELNAIEGKLLTIN
jgi:hypothetical protein